MNSNRKNRLFDVLHSAVNVVGITSRRSYTQQGGPVSFNVNGLFDPSNMLMGSIRGNWDTDPVKASFGIARTGVTSQVDAKVHLNLFDLGEWKPFGAYGRLTDASGTSRVGGIRFEHPDGHVFIGKGIYTPLTGMPRDYWTMQTVYKTSGNQWVHAAKYVADGQTWFVGAETLAAPNFSLGIFGNFKPRFGAGIYYSSGLFPGIPMPTGFSPIDSVHSGATATINLRLFGKE